MEIVTATKENTLVIRVYSSQFRIEQAEKCLIAFAKNILGKSTVIIDLSQVEIMDDAGIDVLEKIAVQLNQNRIRLIVMGNQKVSTFIRQKTSAQLLASLIDIRTPSRIPTSEKAVDKDLLLNLLFEGLHQAYTIYAECEIQLGPVQVWNPSVQSSMHLAGVGTFSYDRKEGTIILGFGFHSYLKLVSAIMKEEYKELDAVVLNWAAELVNIMMSLMKTFLKQKKIDVSYGFPWTVTGQQLTELLSKRAHNKIFLCQCDSVLGPAFLQIIL